MIQFNASRSIRSIVLRSQQFNGKSKNFPTIQMHTERNEGKLFFKATNCRVITSYYKCERKEYEEKIIHGYYLEFITRSHSFFNCFQQRMFENLNNFFVRRYQAVILLCFMILCVCPFGRGSY